MNKEAELWASELESEIERLSNELEGVYAERNVAIASYDDLSSEIARLREKHFGYSGDDYGDAEMDEMIGSPLSVLVYIDAKLSRKYPAHFFGRLLCWFRTGHNYEFLRGNPPHSDFMRCRYCCRRIWERSADA